MAIDGKKNDWNNVRNIIDMIPAFRKEQERKGCEDNDQFVVFKKIETKQ